MPLAEIDQKLLSGVLSNDRQAWHDFVDRFIGLLSHVVTHTAHSRGETLELADVETLIETIVVALQKDNYAILRQFHGQASLATYLTVIARRVAVQELAAGRLKRRSKQAIETVSPHAVTIVWDPDVVDAADYAALVTAVGDLVRLNGGSGVELLRSFGFNVEAGVPL